MNHIEAQLTFLTPEEGGRSAPVRSGYRGQFEYDNGVWDAIHTYLDTDIVYPGDRVRTLLRFTNPDAHRGRVHVGMPFEVREGRHLIARGTVSKIIDL
jgi:translation elongation factor EF-Tu-like GTPase